METIPRCASLLHVGSGVFILATACDDTAGGALVTTLASEHRMSCIRSPNQ